MYIYIYVYIYIYIYIFFKYTFGDIFYAGVGLSGWAENI